MVFMHRHLCRFFFTILTYVRHFDQPLNFPPIEINFNAISERRSKCNVNKHSVWLMLFIEHRFRSIQRWNDRLVSRDRAAVRRYGTRAARGTAHPDTTYIAYTL